MPRHNVALLSSAQRPPLGRGAAPRDNARGEETKRAPMLSDQLIIRNYRQFVEMCWLFGRVCPDVHVSAHAPRAPQMPCEAKGYNFRPEEPAANRAVSPYMAYRSDLQS